MGETMTERYVLRECGSITLYKDGIELLDQHYSDYPETPEDYEREAKYYQLLAKAYQEDAKYFGKLCPRDTEYYQKQAKRCLDVASYYQDLTDHPEPDWRTWCLAELEYYKTKLSYKWVKL